MGTYVGIGGWTFGPWRETFYPPGLVHRLELDYASRHVTAIEINGTFYRTQTPASYRRWAGETPDGFVFSLKAPRAAVQRSDLATAGPSIDRFLDSGPTELGAKLGPILWQLDPRKPFDANEISAFLSLLPTSHDGVALSHALEVRHASFLDAKLVALARKARVALVFADSQRYPCIADLTADFVYARLQDAQADEPLGYPPRALERFARLARAWAAGESPAGLPYVAKAAPAKPRRVFVFMINGAKERAPAAAMALIARLAQSAKAAKPAARTSTPPRRGKPKG